jgi:hypothetical protein
MAPLSRSSHPTSLCREQGEEARSPTMRRWCWFPEGERADVGQEGGVVTSMMVKTRMPPGVRTLTSSPCRA